MAIYNVEKEKIIEINGEGKYPALGYFEGTIEHASLDISRNGSRTLTLNLKSKNEDEWAITVYNAIRLTNNDGTNNFQVSSHLIPLLCVLGIKEFDDEKTTPKTIKIGKAQTETIIQSFPILENKPIACWLKKEYRLWNGQLKESYFITDFFRQSDKASGKEIKENLPIGEKFKEVSARNETEVFADGLTKEIVAKMKNQKTTTTTEQGWDTTNTSSTPTTEEDIWDD